MKQRYESKVVVFLVLTRIVDGKKEVLLQKRCNTGYIWMVNMIWHVVDI